jgi:hypothetical protein
MNKVRETYWTENIIISVFFLLTISESIGEYIWQGNGIRHLYLLFIVFFVATRDLNKIIFNKSSFKLLIILIFYFVILSYYSSSFTFSSFLGWFFTYFFFIIFIPFSINLNLKFNYIYVLKRIVLLIFLLSLYPFFNSLINFPSFRSSYGLFRDQSGHSSMLCVGVIMSNYLWLAKKKKIWKYLIIFFVGAILLTSMKKSILFIGIWLVFVFLPSTTFKFKITFSLIISLFLILVLPTIVSNVNSVLTYESNSLPEDHVRWGMYIGALSLAISNFPFGSGYSSFGSLFSVYDFKSGTYRLTKTYYDLGLNNLADNEIKLLEGNTTFLDTYYPHIYGEGGIIQLILIIVLIVHILKILKRKCYQINDLKLHKTFLWIVLLVFIDGITINSPEMPVFIFFYSVLPGLIIASKKNKYYK